MEGGFRNNSRLRSYEEANNYGSRRTEESFLESPPSTGHADVIKLHSHKRSKRSLHKKVVSIPMKESEGSRLKGDGAPPADSWAWRKYGQKPIKGSPYPRGYYKCSSSKGCPARKQVERSRNDPTMLVITYTGEHNHRPWPSSPRNSHHTPSPSAANISAGIPEPDQTEPPEEEPSPLLLPPPVVDWFTDMETTTSSTLLESPFFSETGSAKNGGRRRDADMAMFFPMSMAMAEEDESLFADLGELPECSVVFRHRDVGTQVQIC